MISINDFCDRFNACDGGREWAVEHCKDMQEVWDTIKPNWLVWIATHEGVLDDRTLRLFACWSVRQVWHLLTDERSRNAVEVAERFANGEVTVDELEAAWAAARDAWSASEAAREKQAEWLRANAKPNFDLEVME